MKHIPKIFPLSLLLIVALMFFIGAYAISENAVGEALVVKPASAYSAEGPQGSSGTPTGASFDWYEQASLWVCPLH